MQGPASSSDASARLPAHSMPMHVCTSWLPATQGYDATSHFETEIHDVMDLYRRITGGQSIRLFLLSRRACFCSSCWTWRSRASASLADSSKLSLIHRMLCLCAVCAGKPLDLEKEDLRKRQESQQ